MLLGFLRNIEKCVVFAGMIFLNLKIASKKLPWFRALHPTDEDPTTIFTKKSRCTISAILLLFQIVFAASNVF